MNRLEKMVAHLVVQSVRSDARRPDVAAALGAVPESAWPEFFQLADRHGLTPLIADRWQSLDVLSHAPKAVRDRLLAAHRSNDARNAHVRREVAEYWNLLAAAQVPAVVLKGWPLAASLYESPALRLITDLDVLVPAERAAAGLSALESAGLEPLPTNRDAWVEKHLPAYWRLNGRAVKYPLTDMFDPLHPRAVELHLSVWERSFRGLRLGDPADFWRRSRQVEVAGRLVCVPSLEDTLIHLCVHWTCHWIEREARLNQLVDLERFMRKHAGQLDWQVVLNVSNAARVTRYVYAALRVARLVMGASRPPVWVENRLRAACPRGLRSWIERYARDDVMSLDLRRADKGLAYVLTWLSAESWRERIGVAGYAWLPSRGFIMSHYGLTQRWLALPFYFPYALSRTLATLWPFAQALTRAIRLRGTEA